MCGYAGLFVCSTVQAQTREKYQMTTPTPPEGKDRNWVQTIPSKSWFMILRLYGPLKPWFDKTWRPGDIELQE
ncbi:MAG TPA: hypothetical protein DCM07_26120 [Planctomycetaceae bacterium]|nr:hypothetical protein [Gimesia sp.]HAH48262.1 hypothetical protein [Planctomycetaceae bacterium]HBL48184.1 hypothetical protein [Planctomycetaceae bacterium]